MAPSAMGQQPAQQYGQQPAQPYMMMPPPPPPTAQAPTMWAAQSHVAPTPQQHVQPTTADEVRTLWIGDLQYWMEETYLFNIFAITGEVYSFPLFDFVVSVQSCHLYVLDLCFTLIMKPKVFMFMGWVSHLIGISFLCYPVVSVWGLILCLGWCLLLTMNCG